MKKALLRFALIKIVILTVLISPVNVFSQIRVKCCGIDQTIPVFKQDSIFKPISDDLEQLNILEPINQSNSYIEIRIYDYAYTTLKLKLTVIKCVRDSFSIVKYTYRRGIGLPVYRESAKISEDGDTPITKKTINKFLSGDSVNIFFKALIDNHLFDLPSEYEFEKIIGQDHLETGTDGGGTNVELKVGSHYRFFWYKFLLFNDNVALDPVALDIAKYRANVMQLLKF